jgi:16S rRNA (cytosine967-C5)-methyltransferase
MHPNALLDLCAELLRAVLKFDAPADSVVSAFFRKHRDLGQRERHTLAETTYNVLRRRLLFQHLAQSGSGPTERRLAILGWQGSDSFLRSALGPHEQQWLQQARAVDVASLGEKLRHNLPDWLAGPLHAQLPDDQFRALADSLNEPAPLDLRVNILKARRDDVARALAEGGIEAIPTPHSPWGLRVAGKPALTRLDVYTRGLVEVQDEGSQLLALLVDAKRGEMVVDFCAGAGGKTLALGAAMRGSGQLYALDASAHRLDRLKPRLARSGLANVYTMQLADEHDERLRRLAGKADRVLVDAPCSGLGTLRRDPDLKWRRTEPDFPALQLLQRRMLREAAAVLKPGGRLIYSTCSSEPEENEELVREFVAETGWRFVTPERLPPAVADLITREGFLRTYPFKHGVEAFFAAVLGRG